MVPSESPSESQSPSRSSSPSLVPSLSVAPTNCDNIVKTSEVQTLTTNGGVLTFDFSNLPNAVSDVSVEVFVRGDLDLDFEFYEIIDEDESVLGRVGEVGFQCSNSCCLYTNSTFIIGQDKFNSYIENDGAYTIVADASSAVDVRCNGRDDAFVRLTYTSCFKTVFPTSRPSLSL